MTTTLTAARKGVWIFAPVVAALVWLPPPASADGFGLSGDLAGQLPKTNCLWPRINCEHVPGPPTPPLWVSPQGEGRALVQDALAALRLSLP